MNLARKLEEWMARHYMLVWWTCVAIVACSFVMSAIALILSLELYTQKAGR